MGISARIGRRLAAFLERPSGEYHPFAVTPRDVLSATLAPGDVLLVEGNSRISSAIKYLTHSTWSHSAFYTGEPGAELIEADLQNGVTRVPLSKYDDFNTRICRAVGLRQNETDQIIGHMSAALGRTYDLKNITDLARYLLPQPPVPRRFRRRMLALGSGDPTRAICSTLIAEAFQSIRYPILPEIRPGEPGDMAGEIHHIRHHSLFTPRDFDLSPYFAIVKPTLAGGFDFSALTWGEGLAGAQPSNQRKTRP